MYKPQGSIPTAQTTWKKWSTIYQLLCRTTTPSCVFFCLLKVCYHLKGAGLDNENISDYKQLLTLKSPGLVLGWVCSSPGRLYALIGQVWLVLSLVLQSDRARGEGGGDSSRLCHSLSPKSVKNHPFLCLDQTLSSIFIKSFRHYLNLMGLVGPDLCFSMVLVDTCKKVT